MSTDTTQNDPAHPGPAPYPSGMPGDRPPTTRLKKALWGGGALALLLLLVLIVHAHLSHPQVGANFRGGFRVDALAVGVAAVTTGDVPITINSLGTVTPLATVTVHSQVTGPLVKIDFTEGQLVKAGAVLAEIDPRPFQAALDQSQGQLQHDQALLANARVDLVRYKTLLAQNSVAEQTYATQQATVLQDEATVLQDKAAAETARLNLSYCRILSPVNGSVGLRQVDLGNVVTAYTTEIVVVTQLQPMSVLFTVPEDNVTEVLQRLHRGEKLTVDAYDRSFTTKLESGVLSNTDNEIDTTTGTLKLRALFANEQSQLFPSQFVNVRLTLTTLSSQLLVPGAAVLNGASGSYVYVVDRTTPLADIPGDPPARTVHVRYVSAGPTAGNMISIRSGLAVGESVVVDGADQLRDGAHVTIPSETAEPPSGAVAGAGNSNANGNSQQHPHHRQRGASGQGQPAGGAPPQ